MAQRLAPTHKTCWGMLLSLREEDSGAALTPQEGL